MVDSTTGPQGIADDEIQPVSAIERKLRASRIKSITFGQFKAIRAEAITLGLPLEVASTLPWYAADPQAMVSALRAASHRKDLVARGVPGVLIEQDLLVWGILKSLENMRAEEFRYTGSYTLSRYGSAATDDGFALRADLSAFPSPAEAIAHVASQLSVVDDHIDRFSPYGQDIRRNGIRRGGVMFPLVIDLPGQVRIGGLEGADSYSRTMFAQHFSGLSVSDVFELWQAFAPTTPKEFSNHPFKRLRDKVLSTAERVREDVPVEDADVETMLRSVMPKTTIVLAVDQDATELPLDEIRRRLVSEQHLDRQLDFTPETRNETRAEAVIGELVRRRLVPEGAAFTQDDVVTLLESPRTVIENEGVHRDDVIIAAAAAFLPEPKSRQDRLIFPAVASRGVITPGDRSKRLRSELAAQVVMRAIDPDTDDRALRRSALERALRLTSLRGARFDDKPIAALLDEALTERAALDQARRRGEVSRWGPAMRQLALRGGFYLFFGPELALRRSKVGGTSDDDNREPGQILELLATTESGLQQLAQAIFDGRNGVALRAIAVGETARDIASEPATADRLDDSRLRGWVDKVEEVDAKKRQGEARDPAARARQDALQAARLVGQLETLVDRISSYVEETATEDGSRVAVGPPYVRVHGLRDEDNLRVRLPELARTFERWEMLFAIRGGSDTAPGGSE